MQYFKHVPSFPWLKQNERLIFCVPSFCFCRKFSCDAIVWCGDQALPTSEQRIRILGTLLGATLCGLSCRVCPTRRFRSPMSGIFSVHVLCTLICLPLSLCGFQFLKFAVVPQRFGSAKCQYVLQSSLLGKLGTTRTSIPFNNGSSSSFGAAGALHDNPRTLKRSATVFGPFELRYFHGVLAVFSTTLVTTSRGVRWRGCWAVEGSHGKTQPPAVRQGDDNMDERRVEVVVDGLPFF